MVVDDDQGVRHLLRSFLSERGYRAVTVDNAEDALACYHSDRPAAVILDVALAGRMDGLEALAAFRQIDRDVPVIMLSGCGRTPTVVQAMKLGASDFVGKPFEDAELATSLESALKQRRLSHEVASLRKQLQSQGPHPLLFRHSPAMIQVRDLIERVADTDVTVLIRGESGTGKELVARALSSSSLRRDKPFVKVNCAALPADLLESELFGFERGAFTGALQQKPGKFEFANHGTLFLDEIGDMSPALQAKLLRVLQDGEFSRLGGTHDVHVDVRIVAATNCDLESAVADGRFRDDLFFRLNVVTIQLPPLRHRREEIPMLTEHFLKKYSVQYNKPHGPLTEETMRLLVEHDWPGNVRELENVVKRIVVLGDDALVRRDLSRSVAMAAERQAATQAPVSSGVAPAPVEKLNGKPTAAAPPADDDGRHSLKDVSRTAARKAERELIFKMLQQTRWNRKATAAILGISYKALLYKIKENGLDKAS
jgi:two-component system response regulator AtoC